MTLLPEPVRDLIAEHTLLWHTDRVDPTVFDPTVLDGTAEDSESLRRGRSLVRRFCSRQRAERLGTGAEPLVDLIGDPEAGELAVLVATDLADLRDSLGRVLSSPPLRTANPAPAESSGESTPGEKARPHRVSRVALVLLEGQPSVSSPDPEWPVLRKFHSEQIQQTAVTFVEFSAPIDPARVWPRLAVRPGPLPAWPVIGTATPDPARAPGDPLASVRPTIPAVETDDLPPDVVLSSTLDAEAPDRRQATDHHVLAAPTRWRVLPAEPDWEQADALGPAGLAALTARLGPLGLGPVDDAVHRPVGFDRSVTGAPVGWIATRHGYQAGIGPEGLACPPTVPPPAVACLRSVPGVRVDWRGGHGPVDYVRTLIRLAASGVPVVTGAVPDWARNLVDPALARAWESGAPEGPGPRDIDQPAIPWDSALTREEYAIRQRRAALHGHSRRSWRSRVGAEQGQPAPARTVSVILPTRRPHQVEFALRQVARQRGVDHELILAAHGFTPDPRVLADYPGELQVVQAPAATAFGDLLNQACAQARGEVVAKMDDDDWYGPDFLADALLALDYSGAEVVGCAPEFTFLEPLWLTVRRRDVSEAYRSPVAGGTMCIRRGLLAEIGGFRPTRRYVDAALLEAVRAAGAAVYRFHGTGYVLRRTQNGHTWDPGMGYFLTRARTAQQWRGFSPSALLAADPRDLPAPPIPQEDR